MLNRLWVRQSLCDTSPTLKRMAAPINMLPGFKCRFRESITKQCYLPRKTHNTYLGVDQRFRQAVRKHRLA